MNPLRCLITLFAVATLQPTLSHADDAATLLAEGRYRDAAAAARLNLAVADGSGHDWHVLGDALAAVGSTGEAQEAYQNALQADSDHAMRIRLASSRILILEGRSNDAVRQLSQVLEDAEGSADILAASELVAAGDAARLLGQEDPEFFRRALRLYEMAIARDREYLPAQVHLADLLLEKYNNTEAQALYRQVLAVDSEFAPALFGLARSQYFDHSRQALDTARRAVEVQPTLVPAQVLVARILLEMDEVAAADDALTQALKINPASPEALTLKLMIRYLKGDQVAYEVIEERLQAVAPGYRERYATLAEIAAQKRLYSEAVDFARRGVARFPTFWRARGLLGINLLRLGQVAAGRRHLESAFRGDPFNVWIKNTLDLLDRSAEFAVARRGRFILIAPERDFQILAPLLFPLAEAAYDEFATRYQHEPPTPVLIEVYPNHDDFSVRTVGLVGIEILGVSFGPSVALVSPTADSPGSVNWGSVLWHELAHTFHLSMSKSRVPRWFTEGLAVAEEHRARTGWGADVTPDFLNAYRQGRMPPASRLNAVFTRPSYPQQVGHAYFQAALMMEFIEESYGIDAIRAMLTGFGEIMTTEKVLAEVLGVTTDAFDTAFDGYLRTRFATGLTAVAADESDFESLWRAGADNLAAGNLDAAVSALEAAKDLFPGFAAANSPVHLLAQAYRRRGDRLAAIHALNTIVEIDADNLEAHHELAVLYLEEGNSSAAAGILERSRYINPFDMEIRQQLAGIYETNGEWERARGERAAIARLEPLDPAAAHYRHARALARTNHHAAARRELLRALEMAPLYDEALELLLEVRTALDTSDDQAGTASSLERAEQAE